MEFNQEYYTTVKQTNINGQPLYTGDYLSELIKKMHNNGLDHMDESNIWALHYGSRLIGSAVGDRIAGTVLKNGGGIKIPANDAGLVYGEPGTPAGAYGKGVAIRWFYNEKAGNNRPLGTMEGTIYYSSDAATTSRVITNMCIKNLIALPSFRIYTFAPNKAADFRTNVSYSDAAAVVTQSYENYAGTFEVAALNSIDFYYGDPGRRRAVNIFPLIEGGFNGITYFGALSLVVNSFTPGVYPITYEPGETESTIYNTIGEITNNSGFSDTIISGITSIQTAVRIPAWCDPGFNTNLISAYCVNGNPSLIVSDDATQAIGIEKPNIFKANYFTTVYGVRQILNALGIVWAEDETSAVNFNPDAASVGAYKVHLGTLDSDGISYVDNTSEGDDIKKQLNFGICEIQKTPFSGKIPQNPGQEVNPDTGDIPLNTPGVTPFNTFNHMYCMTQSEVNDFASKIWNADETLWEQIVNGLSLYGEMPINAIISLRMYPIDLLKLFDVASTSIMRIGKTAITLDTQTEFVTKQKTAVVNMGSCVFPARYNNFLDYEPYTKAMLYLPYCGTVDVATADVVGKTVQVYYIIDVMTGGCTAVVYFGGIPYFYKNGRVGVEIPITANADSAVTSDALSLVTGGASSLLAAATGNPVAAALSLPSMVNSGLQLAKDSRSSFQTTGTQTPTAAQWTPQNAYFIVQRSVPDEPAGYGHSVGYVTLEGGTLGSFTGYTVMSNPDLTGVDCTEGEKEMIRNLLESGIYC